MVGRGLYEVVGWSFTDPSLLDRLQLGAEHPLRRVIELENPLSEGQAIMRPTLLGSLLDAARHNVERNGPDVAKRIMEAAGGPVLAVIDLVNGTQTARFAFSALRKGGKLIQVGLFGGELMLPLPIMAIRALTVQGSYVGNPKELRELINLAQEGSLEALPVATVPQSQANDALMRLRDGKVTGRLVLKAEAA